MEGEPVLCERGYHASATIFKALDYAHGGTALCRVRLGGKVIHDDDKLVATERTITAMLTPEATKKLLRDWGRWCALQVIHLWDAPEVVRQYLETGDESLRAAAWAAAHAAARDAAQAAARDAAQAARDAAQAAGDAAQAAGDAAQAVARVAAWNAAQATSYAAEIEKYTAELERRGLAVIEARQAQRPPA